MRKIAVIGAGISGAASARRLKEAGHEVTVFEKSQIPGGLVKCTVENGNLFHRVGGHVFNSKDENIANWFWSHFNKDHEFVFATRNAAIHLKDRFIGYPIESHVYQMAQNDAAAVIADLLYLNKQNTHRNMSDESFYDFLQTRFGKTLCEDYFIPYNTKIWNVDLKRMPISWLAGKLPMPTFEEILVANIMRQNETNMVHSQFYYPREGGSQFIVDRLLRGLEVRTSSECNSIKSGDLLEVNGEHFDAVVYTGDVRTVGALVGSRDPLYDLLAQLKSNGTTTILCSCDANPYSWLYIPEPSIKCHRMIMTGNFSPANNSAKLAEGRITCTIEFVGEIEQTAIDAALAKLPFRPSQIALNYEPRSYVIQDLDTRDLVAKARENLRANNIWLCGRFAEWEYFNMDAAIASAINVTDEIISKFSG